MAEWEQRAEEAEERLSQVILRSGEMERAFAALQKEQRDAASQLEKARKLYEDGQKQNNALQKKNQNYIKELKTML